MAGYPADGEHAGLVCPCVAGHYGLFQVQSTDTAKRVVDRVQDHMGFTVVGPKTFLVSGHPSAANIKRGSSPTWA
ncbi:hypothetical protein AB0M44_41215 [Streptosporangium subroseum]|uniref:hypothetical protein n=1 Tax=Streptosporangium subroseum TaxID=106412 RepID=UPI00342FE706